MIIENNEIIFKDWMQKLIKVILTITTPFLTILLSNRYDPIHILIGAILSFIISLILFIKVFKVERVNVKKLLLVTFISLYVIKIFLFHSYNNLILLQKIGTKLINIELNFRIIKKVLGFISIPSVVFFLYIFIDKIKLICLKFKKSLTKVEKRYLLITLILSIILSVFVTTFTKAFVKPIYNNHIIPYDVIYTTDTGAFMNEGDAFFNVSNSANDLRQPLFGLFALPFSLIAKLLSEVCFFLPIGFEYGIFLTIIQFLLTSISTILIGRLLNLEEKDKKYLYLLFSLSFPYILFNLVIEQYVIALFYLILAIYIYYMNKDKINYMYIGAVGTLLTSGIIFPLITKFKNIKEYIKNIFKCFLAFVSVLTISGQIPQVITIKTTYKFLSGFTGKLSFYDKFVQFTFFIEGLIKPLKGIIKTSPNPVYRNIEGNSLSIFGLVCLGILIISFILNRKEKMAKISFLWVIFSFIILCLVGWGTAENGLILYSLYFAWAYYILFFLLIKKLFKKTIIFHIIMTISIVIISIFSIQEFLNILKFAIKYY